MMSRLTEYGFIFGPVEVERSGQIHGTVFLTLRTIAGKSISISVSPKGRVLRVFAEGKELL